ncbi:MAG: hypothetical protein JXB29_10985 [Sedimentisphaerales bacterium]|nr:hypothetical protein [Sedimentisphaerales bacterium]
MKDDVLLSYAEVIILGMMFFVFAVNVAPRFAQAETDGRICDLIDSLEKVRPQLDLYRAQHAGKLPPTASFAGFQKAMTKRAGRYGPYVKKVPANPFNGLNTIRFDGEPAGANKTGWRLDTGTGLFQADDDAAHAEL